MLGWGAAFPGTSSQALQRFVVCLPVAPSAAQGCARSQDPNVEKSTPEGGWRRMVGGAWCWRWNQGSSCWGGGDAESRSQMLALAGVVLSGRRKARDEARGFGESGTVGQANDEPDMEQSATIDREGCLARGVA